MADLTELLTVIRTLAGDDWSGDQTLQKFSDGQLKNWMLTTFRLGEAPKGYVLDLSGAGTIEPDPAAETAGKDDFALIALNSCVSGISGTTSGIAIRTRGMSVVKHNRERRDLLGMLAQKIYRARGGACAFSGKMDFVNWLYQAEGDGVLQTTTIDPETGPDL